VWEAAPGSWRVFHDDVAGRWTYDYDDDDPVPSPFTTIGWRLAHIAMCKIMYHEWAFGARALSWDDFEPPHDVASSLEMLEEGQALLREDLTRLSDGDLILPRLTNWGEEWPAWRIVWTMIHHDLQHGGEIGALRDLRRTTRSSTQET
jgi:DinB superfamily